MAESTQKGNMNMKPFMDKDFLLDNDVAKMLYHHYAAEMPIIDYHCHVNPKDIAENKKYKNITEVWLGGDHYKWRAMRSCGLPERVITGDASDYEKFEAFATAMPSLIGNPLYHWSHLELKRYFGYEGILSPETCEEVWNICNEKLASDDMTVREIIKKSNVVLLCTTDDPADPLEYHIAIRDDETFDVQVLPAFRPDKVMGIDKPGYTDYIATLAKAGNAEIKDYDSLLSVLEGRIEFFESLGCRTADHGFDDYVAFADELTAEEAEAAAKVIFTRALAGEKIDAEDTKVFKSAMIRFFGKQYVKYGWIMQIHFGALRSPNTIMKNLLGPDTGYDTIHGQNCIYALAKMLDALNLENALPRTILYSLNPIDNAALGTLIGSFQYTSEEAEGLCCLPPMQHGSAWWFNDNIKGMREQLENLANLSALGKFVGMLTDSRSFLSYTRHEYFRRILCGVLAGYVVRGEYPLDIDNLAQMVCDICYNNTKDFFGFKLL